MKLQYIRRWHQVCKHLKSTLIALCLMPKWVKFQGLLGESWKKKYIATSLKLQYFNLYKYFVLNLRRTNKYFFCWNDETFLRFYFDCTLLCWNSTWELFRFCLDSVEIFLRSCFDLAEILLRSCWDPLDQKIKTEFNLSLVMRHNIKRGPPFQPSHDFVVEDRCQKISLIIFPLLF